jgi:hypothetical protein
MSDLEVSPDASSEAATVVGDAQADAPIGDAGDEQGANPTQYPIPMVVTNSCPFAITARASSSYGLLDPGNVQIDSGRTFTFQLPNPFPAASVNGCRLDPDNGSCEHVAVNVTDDGTIFYNTSDVDKFVMPIEAWAVGAGSGCRAAGCYTPMATALDGCPAVLARPTECISARSFCANVANQGNAYCTALDGKVVECQTRYPGQCTPGKDSTPEVYSCTGFFATSGGKWCSALNRGMLADPNNTDSRLYYKQAPFNTYAQWFHSKCRQGYAFATEGYPSGAGQTTYRVCSQPTEMRITFCPSG